MLAKVAADAAAVWQALQVDHSYAGWACHLQIASATAVWRHSGLPAVPILWVLIRSSAKPDAPVQALLCTDIERSPEHIGTWFVRRWCVETTFGEVRTCLGVETQHRWSDRATPCLLALFSNVTVLARCLPARRRRSVTAVV